MRCPFCKNDDSKVIDSRSYSKGFSIKRRRECLKCGKRFTTFEMLEENIFYVVKKNGTKEEFSKEKILKGLLRATVKRDIDTGALENLAIQVESELYESNSTEISSEVLGELIMEKLKLIDEVAYVRFASVYKNFNDVKSFVEEINGLNRKGEQV
ncbi:MAG: transcriptional repressor NrdR [Fusobacteriaceae bacterium]|nr:transcriptional repressor NrdR [Fusobacteriaceae bacterium]MBN2838622.1 transcriptional repressor NrdR [Fusobacteriaceae bacterium]